MLLILLAQKVIFRSNVSVGAGRITKRSPVVDKVHCINQDFFLLLTRCIVLIRIFFCLFQGHAPVPRLQTPIEPGPSTTAELLQPTPSPSPPVGEQPTAVNCRSTLKRRRDSSAEEQPTTIFLDSVIMSKSPKLAQRKRYESQSAELNQTIKVSADAFKAHTDMVRKKLEEKNALISQKNALLEEKNALIREKNRIAEAAAEERNNILRNSERERNDLLKQMLEKVLKK